MRTNEQDQIRAAELARSAHAASHYFDRQQEDISEPIRVIDGAASVANFQRDIKRSLLFKPLSFPSTKDFELSNLVPQAVRDKLVSESAQERFANEVLNHMRTLTPSQQTALAYVTLGFACTYGELMDCEERPLNLYREIAQVLIDEDPRRLFDNALDLDHLILTAIERQEAL